MASITLPQAIEDVVTLFRRLSHRRTFEIVCDKCKKEACITCGVTVDPRGLADAAGVHFRLTFLLREKIYNIIRATINIHKQDTQLSIRMTVGWYDRTIVTTNSHINDIEMHLNTIIACADKLFNDVARFMNAVSVFNCVRSYVDEDFASFVYLLPNNYYISIMPNAVYIFGQFSSEHVDILSMQISEGIAELFIQAILSTNVGPSLRLVPIGATTKAANSF